MKIILYGRGTHAKNLVRTVKAVEILAVTDSFVEGKGAENFLGIPVILSENIKDYVYDYVVIGTSCENDTINKKLIEGGILKEKIINLETFYMLLYKNCYEDSKLWNFFLNHNHRKMSKWVHYYKVYEQWFSKYCGKEVFMLEIGVANGGSVQMWKNYFGSKATIIGVDINPQCKDYEEDQIHIELGAQENPEFWDYIREKYPRIDILLDDGGHTMEQQIITFKEMFPHIENGGIYLCEDTHTSYWKEYGGGLREEATYIEYTKNLIDDINAYHIEDKEANYNTQNIGGIHYYDSMVVIEKEMLISEPFSVSREVLE